MRKNQEIKGKRNYEKTEIGNQGNYIDGDLSQQKLVLLSTHIVSDLEAVANEIILLRKGVFHSGGSSRICIFIKKRISRSPTYPFYILGNLFPITESFNLR